LLFLATWITGFLLPIVTTIENPFINFLLKRIYSPVCHQENLKCISIGSSKMLVCARCTGIYFGALITAISSLFITIPFVSKKILMIAILPLIADVLLTSIGLYSYSQLLSFMTGILFGAVIYLFTILELENLS
jgi:uncharacterized membrane protein